MAPRSRYITKAYSIHKITMLSQAPAATPITLSSHFTTGRPAINLADVKTVSRMIFTIPNIANSNTNGGIIIVGSHVKKTTAQLESLQESDRSICFLEFNQHLVLQE